MPIRLAILGLDAIQRPWLDAVNALVATGEIELVACGHRTLAAARDVAAALASPGKAAGSVVPPPPPFDDLRLMVKTTTPQVLLMDRPDNVTLEFLLACVAENIAILSLGPPVESFAEAKSLAGALEPRSHLLYVWPRFADEPISRHCAQADEYVRPIRFASASWLGLNLALSKALATTHASAPGPQPAANALPDIPVRSLSLLAWDALATLIHLMDVPTSVYAAIRGTVGSGNTFADLSGAASMSLRFSDDAAASVTLCDRVAPAPPSPPGLPSAWSRRDLLLWGTGGTVRINARAYEYRDAEGRLIDSGPAAPSDSAPAPTSPALDTLREFLRHFTLPPSPHRGWEHRLEDVAATMEAFVVSHRTGQAESPERFRSLRR